MTSHYETDQSMISIFDMKKMLGGEAKYNPRDFTLNPMLIHYMIFINWRFFKKSNTNITHNFINRNKEME
jgi:hypothetical protein